MRPGQFLGNRYRLDRRVAAGGMGEVWRASDTKLGRTVAIKALHAGLAHDAAFRRRFAQEARTVAALRAPGVVNLHDACEEPGEDGSTLSYLVMEYVEGRPLSEILHERGRLGPQQTVRIAVQVAGALDAAHRAGIVHRDVKPGNILVDADGRVTLVDFGISRAGDGGRMTSTGMVMGTVSYASPEHVLDRDLTPASDVYSLGVVVYECLAGQPPFTGSAASIINGHLHQTPPPLPSTVPGPVADAVQRALTKDPRRRFATAAEFSRAVRGTAPAAEPSRAPRDAPTVPHTVPLLPRPTDPMRQTAPIPVTRDMPGGEPAEPKKGKRTALIAIALVAVLAGAAALVFALNNNDDDDPNGAQDGQPQDQTSGSDDPSGDTEGGATELSLHVPQTTTWLADDSESCLNLQGFALVECGPSVSDYTFEPVPGAREDVYQIVELNGSCLGYDPSAGGGLAAVGCTEGGYYTDWHLTWLETDDEWEVWTLTSLTPEGNTVGCLSATDDSATLTDCDPEDHDQTWRTGVE